MSCRYTLKLTCVMTLLAMTAGAAAAASAQSAPSTAQRATVGEFLVRFVEAVDPTAANLTPEGARQVLSRRGIVLPGALDPEAALTEGDLAAILGAAGVAVASTDPRRPANPSAMQGLLSELRRVGWDGAGGEGESPDPGMAFGACCLGTACVAQTPGQCWAAGGIFRGIETSCDGNVCNPAVGQCCVSRQDCRILTPEDCAGSGGVFTGRDSCHPQGSACRIAEPVTPSSP